MKLSYIGKGPYSKSLLNRAYVVQSYFSDFNIVGESHCEDAQVIQQALSKFHSQQENIFCGSSATAFRFMALRVSRKKGEYVLSGTPSLLQRPHQQLQKILTQLGVEASFQKDQTLRVKSEGWHLQGDALTFSSEVSSQFASALLMNSFDLEEDLFISLEGAPVSLSYLEMSLSFLRKIGIAVQGRFPEFVVPARQVVREKSYQTEPDMSCLFTLACFASLNGKAIFTPWMKDSIQPDAIFPHLLSRMGISIEEKEDSLTVSATLKRKGLEVDLSRNPDLFPCLSILCALSEGESFLYNVPHLKFKESDRLSLTIKLLQKIGRKVEPISGGLKIKGDTKGGGGKSIQFDPQEDHRMAMAGALLGYAGFDVEIKNRECVKKSFPEFWDIIGDFS